MATLTNVEQEILDRIQYHITMQEKKSLSDLAQECHVAQSTIVKMSKKLGYRGFVELYYQMSKEHDQKQSQSKFDSIVVGNLQEIIQQLSVLMKQYETCKNIIVSYGIHDILSPYLSRKLAMFDIFAPVTYDYVMAQSPRRKKGIAFFCNQREVSHMTWKEMIHVAKQEGFTIVAFSDRSDHWIRKDSDLYIQIPETSYEHADFYYAKVLMLFELWLSEYAKGIDFTLEDDPLCVN